MTISRGRRFFAVVATAALTLGALVTMSAAADEHGSAGNQHCEGHAENPKADGQGTHTLVVDGETVIVDIDGSTVEFYDEDGNPLTVRFCIKAAQDNSGEQVGHRGEVTWTNRGGNVPDISYVVVYEVVDDGPPPPQCPGEAGGISLEHSDGSEDPATNEPGDPHSVTATVTDEDGGPCPDVHVRFEVTGDPDPTPSEGSETTDEQGQADFEFNNQEEGVNHITACVKADGSAFTGDETCDDADHSDTVHKIWEEGNGPPPPQCPGEAGGISLEHSDGSEDPATNEPGDPHSVTATVTDEDGGPCPDVHVRFEVTGDPDPTPSEGSETTDEQGQADFEFNNQEEGVNHITACVKADGSAFTGDETCDDADHSDTVNKIWKDNGVVEPENEAFCRAVLLHLLGEDVFEANPDRNPCADDDAGLTFLLLDALGLTGTDLGGFVFFLEDGKIVLTDGETGAIEIDLAYSRTRGDEETAHAEAGVLDLSIATDEEQIGASVLTSSHTTEDCDSESSGSAKVVELRLGGEVIAIPGEHTVIDQLMPVLYLELEREQPTAQALEAVLLEAIDAAIAFSESGCEPAA